MKDFIYDGGVRIIYGAAQMKTVAQEIAKLGSRLLVIPTGSFLAGGHYETLKRCLTEAGLEVHTLQAGKKPLLSKVNEGAQLCAEKHIDAALGIGGGVSMDLAKAVAFGARNTDVPMEKFLTYEVPPTGVPCCPWSRSRPTPCPARRRMRTCRSRWTAAACRLAAAWERPCSPG